jgi:hypothetical protein
MFQWPYTISDSPGIYGGNIPRKDSGQIVEFAWLDVDDSFMGHGDILVVFEVFLGNSFLPKHILTMSKARSRKSFVAKMSVR